mgnify:CR=1 FL=1
MENYVLQVSDVVIKKYFERRQGEEGKESGNSEESQIAV